MMISSYNLLKKRQLIHSSSGGGFVDEKENNRTAGQNQMKITGFTKPSVGKTKQGIDFSTSRKIFRVLY